MHDPSEPHTAEPSMIRAGDSAKWKISLDKYPSPAWTLSYTFINAAAKFTVASVADGANHSVTITPAVTEKYASGEYQWQAAVTDGADRYTIREGRTTVLANFANADYKALDTRSHARRTLDAVNAVIEDRAGEAELSYSIAGRSLQFTPLKDLVEIQQIYEGKVRGENASERLAGGKKSVNTIKARL